MLDYQFHVLIPIALLIFIFLGVRFYGILGCETPLEAWFIGLEAIAIWGCFLHFLCYYSLRLWRRSRSFVLKSALILLIFSLIWDILGIFWTLKELTLQTECLSTLGSTLWLTIQFIFIGVCGMGISSCWSEIKNQGTPGLSRFLLREQLIKYYGNEIRLSPAEVATYLNKYRYILESMKILKVEKKLIRDYFTLEVTERSDEQECAVCLGTLEVGELKSVVGCMHQFHYECLIQWFGVKPSCPLCKLAFRPKLMFKHLENARR